MSTLLQRVDIDQIMHELDTSSLCLFQAKLTVSFYDKEQMNFDTNHIMCMFILFFQHTNLKGRKERTGR